MAIYQEDVTLTADAATPPTESWKGQEVATIQGFPNVLVEIALRDQETPATQASAAVILTESLALLEDLTVSSIADILLEALITGGDTLTLGASADILLEEEIPGSSDITLLAIASAEIDFNFPEEMMELASADILLEEEVESVLGRVGGGTGSGAGPAVRTRPDGDPSLVPTTRRRQVLLNG